MVRQEREIRGVDEVVEAVKQLRVAQGVGIAALRTFVAEHAGLVAVPLSYERRGLPNEGANEEFIANVCKVVHPAFSAGVVSTTKVVVARDEGKQTLPSIKDICVGKKGFSFRTNVQATGFSHYEYIQSFALLFENAELIEERLGEINTARAKQVREMFKQVADIVPKFLPRYDVYLPIPRTEVFSGFRVGYESEGEVYAEVVSASALATNPFCFVARVKGGSKKTPVGHQQGGDAQLVWAANKILFEGMREDVFNELERRKAAWIAFEKDAEKFKKLQGIVARWSMLKEI